MLATLNRFLLTLNELRQFVNSIPVVYRLIIDGNDEAGKDALSIRHKLDYAAFVTALYAAFETFIEDLVWSRAESEALRLPYERLPKKLKNKHLRYSAELLHRRLGEGRYVSLSALTIIENLYRCESSAVGYRLTKEAVVHHEQNLYAEVVAGLLALVGVENLTTRVASSESLLGWFQQLENFAAESATVRSRILFRVRDLVQRRNEASHAASVELDSLAPQSMHEFIGFLEAYARSIFDLVARLHIMSLHGGGGCPDLSPFREGPLRDGFVVVVDPPPFPICVGHAVFSIARGSVSHWGKIAEIRLNDTTVPSFSPGGVESSVGIRLTFRVKEKERLIFLGVPDDLVWS